mgnify:CR=1 FL=1
MLSAHRVTTIFAPADDGIETIPVALLEVDIELLHSITIIELGTTDKVCDIADGATLYIRTDVGEVRDIAFVVLSDILVVCTEHYCLGSLYAREDETTVNRGRRIGLQAAGHHCGTAKGSKQIFDILFHYCSILYNVMLRPIV